MKKPKKLPQIPHHTDHVKAPRTIDSIRARANLEMTYTYTGLRIPKEVESELARLCFERSPEDIVILMQKDHTTGKYYTEIYITKEDFNKPVRKY